MPPAKQWNDPYLDSLADKTHEIRSDDNPIVTLETNFGNLTLELYRDVAPAHADSFLARTNDGFYSGTVFHRVIDNFMIQGGDPKGNGTGNAGYFLDAEFSDLPHVEGTLSMARGRSENSASCQFFICLARNPSTEYLDGKYTVFGHLLRGYDVLHAIGNTKVEKAPTGEPSKPVEPVKLIKAYESDEFGKPL
ncbi:peptidylprolyl isomerase [candidate division GN15 bacterium]|nr:peptidylprolyl isomerase [candidate division GN15 bacterium]